MYNNLNFHTVNKVSKKLGLPEEIIMDLIKRNILEAVSVEDTGIWIVEEKAVLKFLAKGNNFKNNYGTENMDVEAVNNLDTTSNNEAYNGVDKEMYIKEKEVMSNNSSNTSTAINIHHNNELNTVKPMMIKKVLLKENKVLSNTLSNNPNINNKIKENSTELSIDKTNKSDILHMIAKEPFIKENITKATFNKIGEVNKSEPNKVITSNKNTNDVSVNSHNFNNSNNLNIEIDASNLSGEELIEKVIDALSSVNTTSIKENNIIRENLIEASTVNAIIEENNMNRVDSMEPFMANTLTKEKEEIQVSLENTFSKINTTSEISNINNKIDHISENSNKNNEIFNDLVISKSDIVKHKDGNYVANNKFFNEENVIAEFIFDAEQAKKPVTDEIVLSKLSFDDNVHICDDQEANAELLRKYDKGNSV